MNAPEPKITDTEPANSSSPPQQDDLPDVRKRLLQFIVRSDAARRSPRNPTPVETTLIN